MIPAPGGPVCLEAVNSGDFIRNGSASWIADAGLWLADMPSNCFDWRNGRVFCLHGRGIRKIHDLHQNGILKYGQLLGSYIPGQ